MASAGDLQLRNVTVTAPSAGSDELGVGDDATLTLTIANMGEANDRLVSVSSPAASSVELLDGDGSPVDRVEVPPLGAVDENDFEIRLAGLTQAFRPGQHMDVTFEFTRGGRQTLVVPIEVYSEPVPRPTYDVFHIEEGGAGEGEGEHSDQEGSEPVTEAEGAEGLSEG